jgi:hypothetical protein
MRACGGTIYQCESSKWGAIIVGKFADSICYGKYPCACSCGPPDPTLVAIAALGAAVPCGPGWERARRQASIPRSAASSSCLRGVLAGFSSENPQTGHVDAPAGAWK